MVKSAHPFAPAAPGAGGLVRPISRRIPLAVRILVYGAFFLTGVLVGLAWLAYRIDVPVPVCHVEMGWFRTVGAALFVACLSVYVRSSCVLSTLGRGAYVEFDAPRELVASGPYRWVRNPISVSVIGMLLGEALALSSTGVLLMFLLSLPVAHLQVVFLEEPLLRRRFGQSYVDYLAQVPRWLPRLPRRRLP